MGDSEYVLGRITGAQAILCAEDYEMDHGFALEHRYDSGVVITTKTTDEKYAIFAKVIESCLVPGS